MTILQVRERVTHQLMAIPGVVGVGVSLLRNSIVVYTKQATQNILSTVPGEIEGHKVELLETGEFKALKWEL